VSIDILERIILMHQRKDTASVNRIGLSIIAIDSDGGGSAAGVQLLITLFYEDKSFHNKSNLKISRDNKDL
jgi:hypothetical protein